MNEYNPWSGVAVLLALAPVALVMWAGMIYGLLRVLGIKLQDALDEITLPESVFFGAYSFSAAYLISEVLSRFV